MNESIEATTMAVMGRALDAAALRQQIGAHNIANANTGAPVGRVVFEERLSAFRAQLASGLPVEGDRAADVQPTVTWEKSGARGVADLDREVARLSQNSVHYQALLRTLNHYLELRATAINEGRR